MPPSISRVREPALPKESFQERVKGFFSRVTKPLLGKVEPKETRTSDLSDEISRLGVKRPSGGINYTLAFNLTRDPFQDSYQKPSQKSVRDALRDTLPRGPMERPPWSIY